MKLNLLESHDRLLHFKKEQEASIAQGAADCLLKNSLSLALQDHSPYIYIFAHPRTREDGVSKKMLWQPRLTRPTAQTNSYLFRAASHTDILEICWLLPPREMWKNYQKGMLCENELVMWSIHQFTNNREALEKPLKDDLSETEAFLVYKEIKDNSEVTPEI